MSPEIVSQLFEGMGDFHADLASFPCPALAIYAYQTADWSMPDNASEEIQEQVTAYIECQNREYKDRNVKRAWNGIPNVKVVVYEDTSHYCFLDKESEVAESMKAYLL